MVLKTKQKAAPPPKELSLFMREVYAIFFLAVGVFVLLCLFSYHPLDPSFFTLSHAMAVENSGGIIGAYLSDLLLNLFGAASFVIGGFLFIMAVFLFAGVRNRVRVSEFLVGFAFVVLLSILCDLLMGPLIFGATSLSAGGLVGGGLASVGVDFLGRPGTYLLVALGTLMTFVWATQVSLRQITGVIKMGLAKMAQMLLGQSRIHWARVKKVFEKWQETRKKRNEEKAKKEPDSLIPAQVRINRTPAVTASPAVPVFKKVETPKPAPMFKPMEASPSILPPDPHPTEPQIFDRIDKKKAKAGVNQMELGSMGGDYALPPLSLLDSDRGDVVASVDEDSLKMQARMLEKKLMDFNVDGRVTEIHPGPVITMYEFEPAPGVKLSRIANLVDDLSLAMGGRSVRIVAPLPNKPAVGIEIPNNVRETVWLKDIIADDKFQKNESKLIFALGKDIEGIPYVSDLAKMPHLLVAGATGAGKSVSINSMIVSILYKARPEEVRLIMVDPKMLELSIYEGIPHLLLPVVTEPKKAALALRWAVREMERRYKLLSDINARNIINYNKKVEKKDYISRQADHIKAGLMVTEDEMLVHEEKLPYIVILIDELADLMMVSSREVEESITRLAQMARAAGIHLILATQRPSVDVLTGVIKANFPARISFKVSSKHDARTILDTVGSEHLLGNGDMLFIPPGVSRMVRVHGAFISETEITRIVDKLKEQAKPVYDESILKPVETAEGGEGGEEGGEEADALYDQAVSLVAETRQASISMIQRRLRIGYNRAARMIEKMETEGIVSPPSGAGHRQVLVSSFQPNP